jgi:hypothetical protein
MKRPFLFLLAAGITLSGCAASRSQADRDRGAGRLPRADAAGLVSAELQRRVVYTVLPEGPICYEPFFDPQSSALRSAHLAQLITGLDKDGRGRRYQELPEQERAAFGCTRAAGPSTEVATVALTDKGRAEAMRWWVPGQRSDWLADGRPTALWRIPFAGQRLKDVGAVLTRGPDAADVVFAWEWVELDGSAIADYEFTAFLPFGLNIEGAQLQRPPEVDNPLGPAGSEHGQVARAERTAAGWRITRMDVPDPGFGLFLEVLPASANP